MLDMKTVRAPGVECSTFVRHHSNGIKITRLTKAQNTKIRSETLLALEKRMPTLSLRQPMNQSPTEPSTAGGAKNIAAPSSAQTAPVPHRNPGGETGEGP